jgi:hypothetical protein
MQRRSDQSTSTRSHIRGRHIPAFVYTSRLTFYFYMVECFYSMIGILCLTLEYLVKEPTIALPSWLRRSTRKEQSCGPETSPLVRRAAGQPTLVHYAVHHNPDPLMWKAKPTKQSRGHHYRMGLAFKLSYVPSRCKWWAHHITLSSARLAACLG